MFELVILFLILLTLYYFSIKPKNFPPGPPCLPIIGSTPFMKTKNIHLYLENAKQQYGPVIGFKIGSTNLVAIAGTKEVKEVLTKEEFQGRPKFPFANPGIIFEEGDAWTTQRRFTLRHLRDFGFGKASTESVILEEVEDFFRNVFDNKEIVEVSGLFNVSAINVLWAMMAGVRFSHGDKDFRYLLDLLQKRFRGGNPAGGISIIFPDLLRKLLTKLGAFKKDVESKNHLFEFLDKAIAKHKKTKTDEPRDFLDVYLNELEKKDLHSSFNEEKLKNICVDFFSAGSESVGNSLGFCILYCVLYPEWQEKLFKEIKIFIENGYTTYLEGKKNLPNVEAFISEVTRCNTIASMAVPHKAIKDTTLNGYFIPKDTFVLVSLWSVLQDKEHWEDPENFKPERFLDADGNYKRDEKMMFPFGLGKRICPGESLARSIIWVFFISLIRHYKFSIPKGHPKPQTLCLPGFTNAPQPFKVRIQKRTELL